MSTVLCAHSGFWSTHTTLQPSFARRIEIARPLPIPSPAQPAPVTMATLPAREREGGVDWVAKDMIRDVLVCLLLCRSVTMLLYNLSNKSINLIAIMAVTEAFYSRNGSQ